jgi:Fic family protein
MARITGSYVRSSTTGEVVRAFVPHRLPPARPPLDMDGLLQANQLAELALARLSGVSGLAPSVDWLLYGAVRKEALLTSQIEGTQATLSDVFDDEAGLAVANPDDVQEVTNYIRAFRHVQQQLRSPKGLPISIRLLRDAHKLLMQGVRGAGKQPGQVRKSQNWIGGTRPGNAAFVPAPPDRLPQLLSDLEQFIHAHAQKLPPLVNIALVHAQFETIHPFLDGNGRLGRLLIGALLEHWHLLPEPLLYLSSYLKERQSDYYACLDGIRARGDWESWITFFLEGVTVAAQQAERSVIDVATRVVTDRKSVLASPRAAPAAYRLFEMLPMMPRFTVVQAQERLQTSFPTANAAVRLLEELGIAQEMTGQRSNRIYSYQAYVELLMR